MNTTWRNTIDVGKTDPERMICKAARSDLDYYLFRLPERPQTVMLDSVVMTEFNWDERSSTACVKISACGAAPRTLKFN